MQFRQVFVLLVALCCAALAQAAGQVVGKAGPDVRYDTLKDQLTVKADQASLVEVLTNIARQTGLDVRVDPSVETRVQADFSALPLETALARLTGKLNVIKSYKKAPKGAKGPVTDGSLLVGITVLPQGKTDTSKAVKVLDAATEADTRATLTAHREKDERFQMDRANQRWQARVAHMSDSDRKSYDKALEESRKREAKLSEVRKQRAAEQQQRKTLHDQRRQAAPIRGPADPKAGPDPEKLKRAQQDFPQAKPASSGVE